MAAGEISCERERAMRLGIGVLAAVLVVSGNPNMICTQRPAAAADSPQPAPKTLRLTYTITELDDGKRIGTQHFAMVVLSGQKTDLKQGNKVPVITGSLDTGSAQNSMFQYLDVGLEILASLDDKGERLNTKMTRSSVVEGRAVGKVEDPVIRQTTLECASILTLGKPLILGSLDIPESTRRLDVEVVMETIR